MRLHHDGFPLYRPEDPGHYVTDSSRVRGEGAGAVRRDGTGRGVEPVQSQWVGQEVAVMRRRGTSGGRASFMILTASVTGGGRGGGD
jgi:hypothetical protein